MQLPDYLIWHFIEAPNFLLKVWRNFFVFIFNFFSIGLLLKTFFAPWRRVKVEAKAGLKEYFEALTFNLVSCGIGASVRFFLILGGVVFLILNFCFGMVIILIWFFLPFFTLPLFFVFLKKEKDLSVYLLARANGQFGRLLKLLVREKVGQFVFQRLNIALSELESFYNQKNTLQEWQKFSKLPKKNLADVFFQLAKVWQPFNKFLFDRKITPEQVGQVALWFKQEEKKRKKQRRFWELDNLLKIPGLGRNLAFGYTPLLNHYSEDLGIPKPFSHQLVGREKEISLIEQVLIRAAENNCLLVGEPGVGKKTIILGFAKKVAEGRIHPKLEYKKVLELKISNILAGGKSLPEMKEKLTKVLQEAVDAGNIILAIENIDLYVASQAQRINLTDIFSQFFSSDKIQVIATATPEAFAKYVFPNSSFLKLFEKVEVAPPTPEEALRILTSVVGQFERQVGVSVTYQALEGIIKNSDRFITEIPFPEKAIDILDEVIVSCSQKGKRLVLPEDVDEIISQKAEVPVGELSKDEKKKLLDLEKILHQQVVDQERAVESLVKAMKRARLGVSTKGKPIGAFLFLGPTGVGKTQTAKALAQGYFGNSQRMVRMDMANFPGLKILIKEVRENPFSVLLLDEIEKADNDILNLFLTVLDEGYLKDSRGKTVSFEDLIIVGTSNAGAEFIRQKVVGGISGERLNEEIIEFVLQNKIFSPEFINRFDAVVVFQPLSHQHLIAIAQLLLNKLAEKMKKEKELTLNFSDEIYQKIAHDGYQPEFGARPMKRVISEQIENLIAEKILAGEAQRGALLDFAVDKDGKVLVKVKRHVENV